VAGEHLARGCDVERAPAPAAEAGFGVPRVVVGNHGVDNDEPVVSGAQLLHMAYGAFYLLAGWHQARAVLERPAVILDMGDLDAAGAEAVPNVVDLAAFLADRVELAAYVHDGAWGDTRGDEKRAPQVPRGSSRRGHSEDLRGDSSANWRAPLSTASSSESSSSLFAFPGGVLFGVMRGRQLHRPFRLEHESVVSQMRRSCGVAGGLE